MQFVWIIAALVVSFLLTALVTPHQTNTTRPAAITDFDFPQFEEGTPQAVFFGDCWSTGWMVLWYGNLRSEPITTTADKK